MNIGVDPGNPGGVMIYVFNPAQDEIEYYETNISRDNELYQGSKTLFFMHSVAKPGKEMILYFDHYCDLFGNHAFVNRSKNIIVESGYFVFESNCNQFKIKSSVQAIFKRVAYQLENKKE